MVRQFIYYTGIGAIGTTAHFLVLYCLVEFLDVDPIGGSTVGFFAGAIVNYLLNYNYTFHSSAKIFPSFVRFFSVALLGAMINIAIMKFLIYTVSLHYFMSQIFATAIIVVITFLINKAWTFKGEQHVE